MKPILVLALVALCGVISVAAIAYGPAVPDAAAAAARRAATSRRAEASEASRRAAVPIDSLRDFVSKVRCSSVCVARMGPRWVDGHGRDPCAEFEKVKRDFDHVLMMAPEPEPGPSCVDSSPGNPA